MITLPITAYDQVEVLLVAIAMIHEQELSSSMTMTCLSGNALSMESCIVLITYNSIRSLLTNSSFESDYRLVVNVRLPQHKKLEVV